MANYKLSGDADQDRKILNQALRDFSNNLADVAQLQNDVALNRGELATLTSLVPPLVNDTSEFTWAGGTSKLSWGNFSVIDSKGLSHPVIAGTSPVLSPSTYYWIGLSTTLNTLAFSTDKSKLLSPGVIVIAQVYTGTAMQSGSAGGGGTAPGGIDLSGQKYKLF